EQPEPDVAALSVLLVIFHFTQSSRFGFEYFVVMRTLLIFFFILIYQNLFAQLPQKFDSLLACYHQNGLFNGAVIIADKDGIVYQKAFGLANIDHKVPNTINTVFGIGSMSKAFTAMLVLQLIQDGTLQFDAPVSRFLPEYRTDVGNKVSIRHLLTHTSGIPSYTALPNIWEDSLQTSYTSHYILKNFGSKDLEFEPGTRYKYGNTGYFMLAMIIERILGKQMNDVLRENTFNPLKMTGSGIDDNRRPIANKANGYYRLGSQYINEPYIYNLNSYGASGVHSTVYDLYLWDRALYTNQLLSEEYMQLYTSPKYEVEPGYAYGFGWEFTRLGLAKNDTVETMEHSGAIRGFRSAIYRVPAEKKCVILLSNAADQSGHEIFENIMQVFRGRKWIAPKRLLADTLYGVMQAASVQKAIQVYQSLKKTDSLNYDFSSYSLELLGERLLMLSSYAEAAAIFQLALNEFPNYTYGYLYLGRAYEKWGKYKEAIVAYQKAVDQDKNSRPGKDAAFQLKRLIE
ncbi:MAG TPA: serine hydrolase, partial [Flavisolibacter sp.]|nr:serine hydrolase [Flavisolibacter sp.]